MPDYGRQTQQRQGMPMQEGHHDHKKSGKSFHELLDCISTDLFTGSAWHLRAANQMRNLGMRGFARVHEYGSCHDHKKRIYLEKLLMDRMDYAPMIDVSDAAHATSFVISDPSKLKSHLEMWHSNESEFVKYLIEAVRMAAHEDMCVYNELACILNGVQEEIMRIKFIIKRLDVGGWSGHDIGVVNMVIHEHMEKHPDAGLDFNLG